MKTIDVSIQRDASSYQIIIGQNLLTEITQFVDHNDYSSLHIITDETVGELYAARIHDNLPTESNVITIESDERKKSVDTVEHIWRELLHQGADRKSLVINLGGGLVGDVGSFAASTFMRGIDFVQVPTTMLAAADASIGGKTGINFDGLKNMVGTFTQPRAVIIDTSVFETLDKRLVAEGLAEIIKHAAVYDETYFAWLEEKLPEIADEHLTELLERSCQVKADIVQSDESESHARKLLNFGHTLGHALESDSHNEEEHLLHGEAVAVGMIAESKLGEAAGITEAGTTERLEDLLQKVGLPTEIPKWAVIDSLQTKLTYDKKNTAGEINWTLLKKIGKAETDQKIDSNLLDNLLK